MQVVGDTLDLSGLTPDDYTLKVIDATKCSTVSESFTVGNQSVGIPAPEADNLQVCSPGPAMILVKNPVTGYGYRLYDTNTSTTIKDEETTGVFNVVVPGTESVFISQYTGTCESARVEVKITVGLSDLTIPNTFTPNGDGVNDLWLIKGIENYPTAMVQIFTRYGQKVFESKGYASPFDGKAGGAMLPSGVYYFIIKLSSDCNLLSGSLTLLR
jgi:gliding motility-associated-like protein